MEKRYEAGQVIRGYGYEWIVLDPAFETQGNVGILCVMKDLYMDEVAFSTEEKNYYPDSDMPELMSALDAEISKKGGEWFAVTLDMTADDGTGWDKEPYEADGAFLLTADMYRKYRRCIEPDGKYRWLATAYSFAEGYKSARYVYTDGSLSSNYAYIGYRGVSPAYVFSLLPEQARADREQERKEISEIMEQLQKLTSQVSALARKVEGY